MTASSPAAAGEFAAGSDSVATRPLAGASESAAPSDGWTDAGGGDAGVGSGSASDAEDARDAGVARDEAPVAEPGEETGTSALTAARSMTPRLTVSAGDRNRDPSHRKM